MGNGLPVLTQRQSQCLENRRKARAFSHRRVAKNRFSQATDFQIFKDIGIAHLWIVDFGYFSAGHFGTN